MPTAFANPLVAVDANVVMDLGAGSESVLDARLLLSSDEHLRGIDFTRLTVELQRFDLPALVIATPTEVVRKFFQR